LLEISIEIGWHMNPTIKISNNLKKEIYQHI